MPNSEAELEAYGKAMEEFVKELASYNEVNEGRRSRNHRGPKRSHHGPSGNGNFYFNLNQDNNPDAQHRERAGSPSGSQLLRNSANPLGQALQNSVPQTLHQGHQAQLRELNGEFLRDFNSLNHLEQLDTIRRLDREIHDRRTSNARHADIAAVLLKFEIVDPVGPSPRGQEAGHGQ
jgi:hypothetical protein